MTRQRYLFRKTDKLKSRKAIEALFSKGNHFSQYPFKFIWLPQNDSTNMQAGVGASSRQFKKAVERNRIKRLMREAWRLQKNPLQQFLSENEKKLSVFILFTGKEIPTFSQVFEKVGAGIQRLHKLINDQI